MTDLETLRLAWRYVDESDYDCSAWEVEFMESVGRCLDAEIILSPRTERKLWEIYDKVVKSGLGNTAGVPGRLHGGQ